MSGRSVKRRHGSDPLQAPQMRRRPGGRCGHQRRRSRVKGKFGLRGSSATRIGPGVWPLREEARQPAALGLVGVDREGLVVAPAGMRDVVAAAAQRAVHPGVDQVEDQRRVHADRRVQAAAAARRGSARRPRTRRRCRSARSGTRRPLQVSAYALAARPRDAHLHALDRGVDVAHRAAGRAFLAQHVPGLERLAQLDLACRAPRTRRCAGSGTRSAARTIRASKREAGRAQLVEHVAEVLPRRSAAA